MKPWIPLCAALSLASIAAAQEPEPVELVGTLDVEHVDTFSDDVASGRWLVKDEEGVVHPLALDDGAPSPEVGPGDRVRVTGARDPESGLLSVASIALLELAGGPPPISRRPVEMSVLVVVIDFQDGWVSCGTPTIEGMLVGPQDPNTFAKYYFETSHERLWLDVEVRRVMLPAAYSVGQACGSWRWTWASAAQNILAGQGVNVGSFDKLIHVVPTATDCPPGITTINNPWSFVSQCWDPQVYTHEFGHQIGMEHASSLIGGYVEYGDHSDTLGDERRRLNAPHMARMGWLDAAQVVDFTSSGLALLTPLHDAPYGAGVRAARIWNPHTGRYIWVSHRAADGDFDLALNGDFVGALSVHEHLPASWPSANHTYLRATLDVGETFSEHFGTLKITHAVFAGQPIVAVDIHPCFFANPTCVPPPPPGGSGN